MESIQNLNPAALRARTLIDIFETDSTDLIQGLRDDYEAGRLTKGQFYLAVDTICTFIGVNSKPDIGNQAVPKSLCPDLVESRDKCPLTYDCMMNGAHLQWFGTDCPWFYDCYLDEDEVSVEVKAA